MMRKKNNIVIGLTTMGNEMLQISVPALGKLRQKFMLVIFNDNPVETVSRRQIRKLGYCGDLEIINSVENMGTLGARMEIVNFVRNKMPAKPDWIVFCDDDDMLIDLEIPDVADDNFAIIQGAYLLNHRVADLLRAINSPNELEPDGENIELARPHIGFAGTPLRTNILFGVADIIPEINDAIQKVNDELDYRAPVDLMMWNFVNMYARAVNPDAVPIYMDKINYIKNNLDSTRMKYGRLTRPVRNREEHYRRALAKYDATFKTALDIARARMGTQN